MLTGERVVLRPLRPDDTGELAAMFAIPAIADAWPGDNLGRLDSRLEGDDVVGMVVEHEGQLIGFIQYYEEDDPSTGTPGSTSPCTPTGAVRAWAPTRSGPSPGTSSTTWATTAW